MVLLGNACVLEQHNQTQKHLYTCETAKRQRAHILDNNYTPLHLETVLARLG